MVDAHCLDCLASSDTLGLEALSCHAVNTMLLEMDCTVPQQLQKNLATLKAPHAYVVNTNTLIFLVQTGAPHNVVSVDPLFYKGLLEETLTLLETHDWLTNETCTHVESEVENGLPPVPMNWPLYCEKAAEQVAYHPYQREARGEHNTD